MAWKSVDTDGYPTKVGFNCRDDGVIVQAWSDSLGIVIATWFDYKIAGLGGCYIPSRGFEGDLKITHWDYLNERP